MLSLGLSVSLSQILSCLVRRGLWFATMNGTLRSFSCRGNTPPPRGWRVSLAAQLSAGVPGGRWGGGEDVSLPDGWAQLAAAFMGLADQRDAGRRDGEITMPAPFDRHSIKPFIISSLISAPSLHHQHSITTSSPLYHPITTESTPSPYLSQEHTLFISNQCPIISPYHTTLISS